MAGDRKCSAISASRRLSGHVMTCRVFVTAFMMVTLPQNSEKVKYTNAPAMIAPGRGSAHTLSPGEAVTRIGSSEPLLATDEEYGRKADGFLSFPDLFQVFRVRHPSSGIAGVCPPTCSVLHSSFSSCFGHHNAVKAQTEKWLHNSTNYVNECNRFYKISWSILSLKRTFGGACLHNFLCITAKKLGKNGVLVKKLDFCEIFVIIYAQLLEQRQFVII